MLRNRYRYIAEASDGEDRRLGELMIAPDFVMAAEWSHFQGVRAGVLDSAHHGPGEVEPVFDEAAGPPYVEGIQVRFDSTGPTYRPPVIPWSYFHQSVEAAGTGLVEQGKLRSGDSFKYRLCAFPVHDARQSPAPAPLPIVDDVAVPLPLESVPMAARLTRARSMGQSAWNAADYPVFVNGTVLDEVGEIARAAGERETGGILVGHLRRDTDSVETYAEITAQITAERARSGLASLTFTPETWTAVRDALALRRRNEIWLGWWHFHPHWCRRCPEVRRRQCVLSRPFFSRDDCELHRAVFDTAFSVALLLSDIGEASLRYDWFGWRHGSIAVRGCYRLPGEKSSTRTEHADADTTPAARVLNVREEHHEH